MKSDIKEATVVMLPTDKNNLLTHKSNGHLVYNPTLSSTKESRKYQPQNLYITTDEEIKEGDYYMTDAGVFKCSVESKRELSNFRKLIATTDTQLTGLCKEWEEFDGDWHKSNRLGLPSIPQSFIETYCKNPVDKVMVEYQERLEFESAEDYSYGCGIELKLTSNNELIIHQIEEKMKKRKKMKYNITSDRELQELALQKHPIEMDEFGFDKNHLLRQVFINGYLLGMTAIIDNNHNN